MSNRTFSVQPVGDALDEYISIAGEGLCAGDRQGWQTYVKRIGIENMRLVYDDARLAGGMAFYRMGQWFGGKELPCAGFSGVAVSPADRGTGACRSLLTSVLRELRDEGVPIASLYASTQYLYRTIGFEHAGTQTEYSMPLHAIGCEDRSLDVHRYTTPPLELLDRVADQRAASTNGNLRRTEGLWQRLLDPYDGRGSMTYLIGALEEPEGFAILRLGSRDGGHPQPLASTDVAANTPRALRRLMTLVRDHRSMCGTFEWFGPPNDAIHFLADEQHISVRHLMRWMLRIVDLPTALATRGYDDQVDGELHFEVRDTTLPENDGRWVLRVADGRGSVEPGGEGHLAMDVRFLAPLFSSFYSAEELRRSGVLESRNESQVHLASRIFAGPSPWVAELY